MNDTGATMKRKRRLAKVLKIDIDDPTPSGNRRLGALPTIKSMKCFAGQENWPIHAKEVRKIERSWLEAVPCRSMRFLWDPTEFQLLDTAPGGECPMSEISDAQERTLLERNLIEPMSEQPPPSTITKLQLEPEPSKQRWRVCHDCLSTNVFTHQYDDTRFTAINQVHQLLFAGPFAATVDFAAYYYQFRLTHAVRKYFAFRTKNGWFQPTVLPMGFTHAVPIAQATSKFLVDETNGRCDVSVATDIYIDNLIVIGSKHNVEQWLMTLREVLDEANVMTSEDTGPMTVATYRGMELDFTNKRVRLTEKFVKKFMDTIPQNKDHWQSWRSTIGKTIYATQAGARGLATIVTLMQFGARHTHTFPLKKVELWESCAIEWKSTVRIVNTRSWKNIGDRNAATKYTLVTDAQSTPCRGAYILFTGPIAVAADIFYLPEAHINVLETQTVARALQQAAEHLNGQSVRIFTDNTVTLAMINKGYSMIHSLNIEAKKIQKTNCIMHGFYVPTDLNIADTLSRGKQEWSQAQIAWCKKFISPTVEECMLRHATAHLFAGTRGARR